MNSSRHHHRVTDQGKATSSVHAWDVSPAEARRIQADLAARVDLTDAIALDAITLVAGIDNTYVTEDGKTTAGAVVVVLTFPEMEVVETTYGNAVIGLQSDKFDLIFALDGTVKRAVVVDFVPQPLFMYGTAVLAHTGADIATWQAINDKKLKIGVPVGTTMESEITRRAPAAELTQLPNINEMIAAFQAGRVEAISGSLTGMTLASGRMPNTIVAMPNPPALFPATAAIRQELDPRWRNFLTTSFGYLAYSGFVQKALDQAYAFRGVDITKVQPVVIR